MWGGMLTETHPVQVSIVRWPTVPATPEELLCSGKDDSIHTETPVEIGPTGVLFCLLGFQNDHRSSPASAGAPLVSKRRHILVFLQQVLYDLALNSDPLTVDYPQVEYSPGKALLDIGPNDLFGLGRSKLVQIQRTVYWILLWSWGLFVVHLQCTYVFNISPGSLAGLRLRCYFAAGLRPQQSGEIS